MAELPGADRGLPSEEPLLGQLPIALGLHLQVDQRLLHGPDGSSVLPQVPGPALLLTLGQRGASVAAEEARVVSAVGTR